MTDGVKVAKCEALGALTSKSHPALSQGATGVSKSWDLICSTLIASDDRTRCSVISCVGFNSML